MMRKNWLSLKGAVTLALRRWRSPFVPGAVRRVLKTPEAAARHYGWPREEGLVRIYGGHIVAQPAAVIGSDGALLWSYAPQLTRTPLSAAAIWRRASQGRPLAGKALYAAVDGFSYYHWLLGTLPKLLAARQASDLAAFAHVIVNPRHKGARNFQTDSLEMLGIDAKKIVWLERGSHLISDELYLPEEPANQSQTEIKPWALHLLRDAFLPLAAAHDAPPGPQRIFISRAQARRRRLVNEDVIVAQLKEQGFVPVVLEELPLLTQIKWFSEAKHVVGLHGAGLANVAFCQPGTQVVELVPESWPNPCFENLAAAVGALYARIPAAGVGPRRGFGQDQVLSHSALPALQQLISV